MSPLELKGRNAYAVNVLNKLRHKLIGRDTNFNEKDANILLESLELTDNPNISPKFIKYSLYGLSNYEESSALELSEIIKDTSRKIFTEELSSNNLGFLRNYLELKKYNKENTETPPEQIDAILKLLNSAIDNIYSITLTKSEIKDKDFKVL